MSTSMQNLPPYRPLKLMRDSRMTKFEIEDFIGIWPNFVPKTVCDEWISYGDKVLDEEISYLKENNIVDEDLGFDSGIRMVGSEQYGGTDHRTDTAFMMNYASAKYTVQVNQFLKSVTQHYISLFGPLGRVKMFSPDIKFQRTPPGGGYHLWHYENASYDCSSRELVWMIFLNDIEEGGETEFMYQKRRIKPTAGTCVIFPAGYTHVHRGGFLMGDQDKYIVTGWHIKTHG